MTDQQDPQVQAEAEGAEKETIGKKVSNTKSFKTLRAAWKAAVALTSPVWFPSKLAGKFAMSGIKQKSVIKPLFAAVALGGYLGALGYGGSLAYVKANDTTSFLNWPASQGYWEGRVTRFSEKGTWPCNSYEGNLRTGEAADSEPFVVRKWDTALVTALQSIPPNTDVTLVYRDNGIDDESFQNNPLLNCIQRGGHTAVGVHYGSVSIGVKPN